MSPDQLTNKGTTDFAEVRERLATPLTDAKTQSINAIVGEFEDGGTMRYFVPAWFCKEIEIQLRERGNDTIRIHYRARQAEMDRDDAFAYIHALWINGQLPAPMTVSLMARVKKWGDPETGFDSSPQGIVDAISSKAAESGITFKEAVKRITDNA